MTFYETETENELSLLEKAVDDLNEKLAEAVGEDVNKAADDGENLADALAEIEAEFDAISDEADMAMTKAATQRWEDRVAKVAADENIEKQHIAMQRARALYPAEYQAYQKSAQGLTEIAKAADRPPAREPSPFMDLARHLMISKNLSGMAAMPSSSGGGFAEIFAFISVEPP